VRGSGCPAGVPATDVIGMAGQAIVYNPAVDGFSFSALHLLVSQLPILLTAC